MKLRIFYILAFFVALSACKKDNIENFPHVLKFSGVSEKSDVHVYVKGGVELKDKAIIKKYLAEDWLKIDKNYKPTGVDFITFSSKDTCTFGVNNLKYSVQKSGDKFLFYSQYPFRVYMMETLDPYIAYKAEAQTIDIGSGYSFVRKAMKAGQGNYNNIKLSFMVYKLVHVDGYVYSMVQGGLYNEINKSSLRNLQQGDTLAVQEFTINYKN